MSDLVEKVKRAISPAFMDGNLRLSAQNELARAAIAAVAEWLHQDTNGDAWDWRVSMKLEKQLEQPK